MTPDASIAADAISDGAVGTPLSDVPNDVNPQCNERITTVVCPSAAEAAAQVAHRIADLIRARNADGKPTVLGLATGHTPIGVYHELARLHREEGLDFSNVITFNLDEYYPMATDSLQSYHRWMWSNFFNHINIKKESVHIPNGTLSTEKIAAHCRDYEKKIKQVGGIDIQILGIGRTGHIGFNEPGSPPTSRTRLISLDEVTRKDAASDFFGEDNVPKTAITMGIATILEAKTVLLMAFGEQKAPIVRRAVEEPMTDVVAASFLQQHPDATFYVDQSASGALTRIHTPWLVDSVTWDSELEKKAVIWASRQRGRSILKLKESDYHESGLASLLQTRGPIDDLNSRVHAQLASVIHEVRSLPSGLNILVFSPHPDDDVISMGGTIKKLVERGNTVHVAYMTSGNVAVFDHDAIRFTEMLSAMSNRFELSPKATGELEADIKQFLKGKAPGEIDTDQVLEVKTIIRWSEARAACRDMNLNTDNVHFLNLPFYQTGQVEKKPITEADITICTKILDEIKPDWVFYAGEMSDPHGTHRMCAQAIHEAITRKRLNDRPQRIFAYRGAWQEWDPEQIDLAVPLSYHNLQMKIYAIFKHQSQKDKALFPGPYDEREFWQRAESRNRETADTFNALGLPEYHAIEAFVEIPRDGNFGPA